MKFSGDQLNTPSKFEMVYALEQAPGLQIKSFIQIVE